MTEIELHPGHPFCTAETLNRIARQQGLCLAMAQAAVFDEICQAVPLPQAIERNLLNAFRRQEDLEADADLEQFLTAKGWQRDDLLERVGSTAMSGGTGSVLPPCLVERGRFYRHDW